jgi:GTPase SAR1 family protein
MKISQPFELKVALLGNVSTGKTTVLNALFRDRYGNVCMKRTTAAVNYFTLSKSKKVVGEQEATAPSDTGSASTTEAWNMVADDPRSAESTLQEIAQDDATLRQSEKVVEKFYDINLEEHICEMRPDTKLVVVDVPGINEAGASSKFKDYVAAKWNTFDCVIVVMDGRQGVNTEEQVELLRFVEENLKLKDIPVIILCNKVDDPYDEEQAEMIGEARREVETIFNVVDREAALEHIVSQDQPKGFEEEGTFPVLLPISALNAFIFRCGSLMTLEEFRRFDYKLVDKLGRERIGRDAWSGMSQSEKYENAYSVITDSAKYKAALADSNFDKFLVLLSKSIGGSDTQRSLINKQIEVALQNISKQNAIVTSLQAVYKLNHALLINDEEHGKYGDKELQSTFWDAYEKLEGAAFKGLVIPTAVAKLKEPMEELIQYCHFAHSLGWISEQDKALATMKNLIRHQMGFVLEKQSLEKLSVNEAAASTSPVSKEIQKCLTTWDKLSLLDWIHIAGSFSLMSYDKPFCEAFGREKMLFDVLMQSLVNEASSSTHVDISLCFSCKTKWTNGNNKCSSCRSVYLIPGERHTCHSHHHYGSFSVGQRCSNCEYTMKAYPTETVAESMLNLLTKQIYKDGKLVPADEQNHKMFVHLVVPETPADPAHFGHLIWLYCKFVGSIQT